MGVILTTSRNDIGRDLDSQNWRSGWVAAGVGGPYMGVRNKMGREINIPSGPPPRGIGNARESSR